MRDVQALCKRVIVINKGRILFDGQLSTLVKRHAPYKQISVVFGKPVSKDKIKHLGEIIEFEGPKAIIRAPSKNSQKIALELLSSFSVDDLTIEEADIEEVVREIFKSSQ